MTVMTAGGERQVSIFVGALPFSTHLYAEATWTQGSEDWLASHVRMFTAWGGTVPKLVPDNLKTGVTHASFYDPVLNPSYLALARHYGIGIVPARMRHPRDKPLVENGVQQVERWVLAPPAQPEAFIVLSLRYLRTVLQPGRVERGDCGKAL
jgi:transposase